MKVAHQGLPNADLPGMAGRSIEPQAPAAPMPVPHRRRSPRCCRHRRPRRWRARTTCAAVAPLAAARAREAARAAAPSRPPVLVAAPSSAPVRAPAPRPPQVAAAQVQRAVPPPRVAPAPLPRMAAAPAPQYAAAPQPQRAAPEPYLNVPRPPGSVGTQEARAQPRSGERQRRWQLLRQYFRAALVQCRVSRARTPRDTIHSSSVTHPVSASGIATGHALAPIRCPTITPLERGAHHLRDAEQR